MFLLCFASLFFSFLCLSHNLSFSPSLDFLLMALTTYVLFLSRISIVWPHYPLYCLDCSANIDTACSAGRLVARLRAESGPSTEPRSQESSLSCTLDKWMTWQQPWLCKNQWSTSRDCVTRRPAFLNSALLIAQWPNGPLIPLIRSWGYFFS